MICIINANSFHIPLKDGSVQCVVTSPPYWGLRRYGNWRMVVAFGDLSDFPRPKNPKKASRWWYSIAERVSARGEIVSPNKKCWIGFLGLEKSPDCLGWATGQPCGECYVCHMVHVFREVWRVLRDDGTLWLNLGDSYAGSGGSGGDYNPGGLREGQPRYEGTAKMYSKSKRVKRGNGSGRWGGGDNPVGFLKPKDLIGIPWRVAFALQADGWYLRMDNIWSKTNPMPESVRDRPTKSHEYMFLLSKSQRYYYDQDAIRETYSDASIARVSQPNFDNQTGGPKDPRNGGEGSRNRSARQGLEGLAKRVNAYSFARDVNESPKPGEPLQHRPDREPVEYSNGRNKWSVWTIATKPYPGSHFATFPQALVEPCVLAGTSEKGCCPECGAPWERVVEKDKFGKAKSNTAYTDESMKASRLSGSRQAYRQAGLESPPSPITTGWRPTCKHAADPIPCVVMDPFSGTATVGAVCAEKRRSYIGLELNPKYLPLAVERLSDIQIEMMI